MDEPWWKDSPDGYEVMAEIVDDCQESKLLASYTPNNGIRIGILNYEDGEWDWFWREFDFNADQAEQLGAALLRWAKAYRSVKSP